MDNKLSPKYAKFDILEISYKVINSHDIKLYILAPKNVSPGKHPVAVRFHGGFMITGASLYPDWFQQWLLDYYLLHSAIAVVPDYRLMPESQGLDVLEDISDFWTWFRKDLQSYLAEWKPGVEADLSKLLVHGESAGGYLSVQSGLCLPTGSINAIIAQYPSLDFEAPYFSKSFEKIIRGRGQIPTSVLENHIKSMTPGTILTSANPPARMDLAASCVQQGRFPEFMGTDEILYPLRRMEKAREIPYTFILHGREDTAVPVEGSFKFVDKVRQKFGDGKVSLHVEPGEHGFDDGATLETPWLKEGLEGVTARWLGEEGV